MGKLMDRIEKRYKNDRTKLAVIKQYFLLLDAVIRDVIHIKKLKTPVPPQVYEDIFISFIIYELVGNENYPSSFTKQQMRDIEDGCTILTELCKELFVIEELSHDLHRDVLQASAALLYNEFYINRDASSNKLKSENKSNIQVGNTSGNIYNGGLYVYNDDCIYKAIPIEGTFGIYKEAVGDRRPQRIYSGQVNNLNIVGDWVYFNEYASLLGGISKIKKDGTSYTNIVLRDHAIYMYVVGEWIYYLKSVKRGFFTSDFDLYLYKVKTDGTNKERLIKMGYNFAVWEEHIYYIKGKDVLRMRNDGTEFSKVVEGSPDDYLSKINIYDGSIYIHKNFGEIHRYDLKSNKQTQVLKMKDSIDQMNVSKDWIYYSKENALYRVNTDGNRNKKLAGSLDNHSSIHVAGRGVIYQRGHDYHRLNI